MAEINNLADNIVANEAAASTQAVSDSEKLDLNPAIIRWSSLVFLEKIITACIRAFNRLLQLQIFLLDVGPLAVLYQELSAQCRDSDIELIEFLVHINNAFVENLCEFCLDF